ncbi:putative ribosomal RNA processing protein [Aspergillus clavatus NRRL 1]|uniref:Ribosomal RNA processing protein, putative n=1 Tax=Aspergillus clavatus (strain ATCC 1007 / CBS 513.65 / DSM 816 / NCTC 3887 / NRRL 1 / QM 1276 / 107) TaxID=344612 RepID=A1CQ15_ASPCL|nr:ribosomal RNA processing protein, putative [Aspergillus clavatus NRRL 1]EAW07736.1 ribosomal RNA processing protein, putative [Aspergillus clavatus NRRL 1]
MDLQKTPFVKELASSDRRTRDKATESLTLFLRSRTDLTLLDLLKLWKGLFFCFYHSDRPLTQQALARNLSYSLVPTLPRATLHRFLRAFWVTIGRDFHSLDRLRLDKYLYLIRCYVGVAFEIFLKANKQQQQEAAATNGSASGKKRKREQQAAKQKKRSKAGKEEKAEATVGDVDGEEGQAQNGEGDWAELESYLTIIEEGPLCPLNFDPDQPPADEKNPNYVPMPHGPDGLRYHVLDIWVDELEKVLEFEEEEGQSEEATKTRKVKGKVPVELLLRPIEKLRKESAFKPVRTRAAETLNDDRLFEWGFRAREVEDEDDDDSEQEWGGFADD